MKKRYFYVVASFMRKDIAKTQSKVDLTIMKEDGSALFPLMEAIKVISEGYSEIADPATIQFDNCIEISKEDYEAFNNLKNLVKVNKQLMKRTTKTVDKYLSDMKKLEDIVKRNKRLIILKTRRMG